MLLPIHLFIYGTLLDVYLKVNGWEWEVGGKGCFENFLVHLLLLYTSII